jgi:hypothetical protein
MEEFAKMIYEQWFNDSENNIDWGDYNETIEKIYDFLNEKIANDLECAINKRVWEVQKNAFIEGFGYACKCLSNGRVELKGGACNE